MRVLDLFSGIGGFSLGLERAGMRTVAFCEINPFCRAVLRKHWPGVPIFEDVRKLTAADVPGVDVICGGFPCQDVSLAGRRAGLGDTRSGLWAEFARLIGEIRPRYAIVENTPGLLSLGMDVVLGDLASVGYDAEWHCIPACYVGADHIRDRVWIIAYPDDWQYQLERRSPEPSAQVEQDAADALRQRLPGRVEAGEDRENAGGLKSRPRLTFNAQSPFPREYREHQPVLGRGIHGVPNRVDRIAALGNAVVPQIPEIIGRAIMQAEGLRP